MKKLIAVPINLWDGKGLVKNIIKFAKKTLLNNKKGV